MVILMGLVRMRIVRMIIAGEYQLTEGITGCFSITNYYGSAYVKWVEIHIP